MRHERGARPNGEQPLQRLPRVRLRDDLGEGTDAERSRVLVQYLRSPLAGRKERQAVLGQSRCRPQLATGAHRPSRPIAQVEEATPIARSASRIDETNEAIEIGNGDERVELFVDSAFTGLVVIGLFVLA